MTSTSRKRRKRTVTLTYADFENMCLHHALEDSDAQAFWRMALRIQRGAALN
jgi:TPP-dependent 2-oxoacid decarboxylase